MAPRSVPRPCPPSRVHFPSTATSRSLLPVDSIRNGPIPGRPNAAFPDRRQIMDLRIVKPITNSEIDVNPSHRSGDGITI
ncbi:hypothetical protein DIE14_30905 [Burkholderia sp. Bp9017]|nr:hypothetical protein DIE14_30905 [Burkholderia sp. Bp9017]RQZ28606.1 hypothetical protein DIE13_27630 [Burkholderia sp. Bp9016]